nr:glycosyltransferase family 4 protein [uncultured Desulfobulbus sp.]
MKLLFLCKRRPQGRDLLTSPYGRFYHLPLLLAQQGHQVTILLCSYKKEPDHYDVHDQNGIRWYSISLAGLNIFRYYRTACRLGKLHTPDWIIGFSDTWYGILSAHLAHHFGCKSLIDAYDNYESYIPWCIPLHRLWRHSMSKATVVTAAGPQLAHFMSNSVGGRQVNVIEMAADPCFSPLSKSDCRKQLGLPHDKILLGYSGSLHQSRGIHILFSLFEKLRNLLPNAELILSGRLSKKTDVPPHVRWLGYLHAKKVPLLINSLDLMFAINKPGGFGNYSYPVKIYEALACGVPIVATDLPATSWVLRDHPDWLFNPENTESSIKTIISALHTQSLRSPLSNWQNSVQNLESLLNSHA